MPPVRDAVDGAESTTAAEQAMLADISLDAPWALVERFSTLVRESGSEDERQAFAYIEEQLRRWGVPYHRYDPDVYLSLPRSARVEFNGRSFRAKAQAFSASTPPLGITGELIYVRATPPDPLSMAYDPEPATQHYDLRGKIVIAEGFADPEYSWDFERRGAIAQIFVNAGERIHWGICTTVWGMPDLDSMDRIPNTPVVAVNRPDGEALIAAAKAGPARVTLFTQLYQGWVKVPIVVADIPGTDEPEKFVLLHGHLDSWDVGIGDNATGDAAMLEMARVFWQHRSDLRRGVRIGWWPGHSFGRYAGSTWWSDHMALDLAANCIATVNCDSPGCRWSTSYRHQRWMAEAEDMCRDAIHDVTGLDSYGGRPTRAGDSSFYNIGITQFYMLSSRIPLEMVKEKGLYGVGGCGGNNEWHTEDDTLEIADPDNLVRDTRVYAATIARVANAMIYPFDFRKLAGEFAGTLDQYARAAGERFDLSLARQEVEALRADLEAFYAGAAEAMREGNLNACRHYNEAILRLARILESINFSRVGRFRHDPAVPIPPLPDLAPALNLPNLSPGTDLSGFTIAHLVRGQNRLVDALRAARREVRLAMSGQS